MIKLPMLSADDKIAEIKRIYFSTTRETITRDFAKALDLLKSLASEEERERAAVFMDGLAEMRGDWGRSDTGKTKKPKVKGPRITNKGRGSGST
jgi:hypothetical protein